MVFASDPTDTSTLRLSMLNSAALAVIRPGISSLAPNSHDLDSSGVRSPVSVLPSARAAMVELGLNDSV